MKLIMKMSVVVAAAAAMMAMTATQAEDGSNRLLDYHQQNAVARSQTSQDSSEQYVQMIKEQPTASGVNTMQKALPPTQKPDPRLTSPIIRDREEYRSAH